jgi:tRNA A-37 threonylcarbamoyl transferase component Bud32
MDDNAIYKLAALNALSMVSSGERKCPFCAERVKIEAKVCHYCRKELPLDDTPRLIAEKEWDINNIDGAEPSYSDGVESIASGSGGRVYIGTSDGNLIVLKGDGILVWSFKTKDTVNSVAAGHGDVVYAGAGWRVYALKGDGSLMWEFAVGNWITRTVTRIWNSIKGGTRKTGIEVSSVSSSPGSLVYVGSENHSLYALNVDGSLAWKFKMESWVTSVAAGPGGIVYAGARDGNVYALNGNGNLAWKFKTGDDVRAVASGPEGRVYVGTWDRNIYVLNGDGSLAWKFKTENVVRSVAPGPGKFIYAGAGEYVYVLKGDGSLASKYHTEETVWSIASAPEGLAYVVYALVNTEVHVLKFLEGGLMGGRAVAELSPKSATQTTVTESGAASSTSMPVARKFLANKYELLREIGRGGMGIVYQAQDHSLKRLVAIKKLRDEIAASGRERERFVEEARTVAQLHHPSIVDIYEIVDQGSDLYLVFEHLDGQSLAQVIEKQKKLKTSELGGILSGTCQALAFAHSKKIVHRDLKPSNIMVGKDGHAKVMDFGIAGQAREAVSRVSRVETSGTFAYMAPEQHLGKWDERSDIYSLGATLYEALTGDIPFQGPDFLAQKERAAYKPLAEVLPGCDPRLDALVARCLKPDPKDRFQTVEEFAKAAGVA